MGCVPRWVKSRDTQRAQILACRSCVREILSVRSSRSAGFAARWRSGHTERHSSLGRQRSHISPLPTATHSGLRPPRASHSLATRRQRTKMAEKFVGKWKLESTENFDDYMKAVGKYRTSQGRLYNVRLSRIIQYRAVAYIFKKKTAPRFNWLP